MQPRARRVAAGSLAGLQARASSPLTRIPPCLRLRHDTRGATGAPPSPAAPSRLAPPASSTSGPSRYSVELPCPPRPSLQPTTTMCSSKGAEEPPPPPPRPVISAARPSPKRNEPKTTATDASARWSTSRTNQPSKNGRRRLRLRAQKERRRAWHAGERSPSQPPALRAPLSTPERPADHYSALACTSHPLLYGSGCGSNGRAAATHHRWLVCWSMRCPSRGLCQRRANGRANRLGQATLSDLATPEGWLIMAAMMLVVNSGGARGRE